jgi:hypothetical protein
VLILDFGSRAKAPSLPNPMSFRIPHSSQVSMTLHLDSMDLPLSQIGDEWIILRNALPETLPSSKARITLTVDARRKNFPLFLPRGISSGQRKVVIGSALEEGLPTSNAEL